MNEMIERVAKAICENIRPDRDVYDAARAAIAAMREPTEAMAQTADKACLTPVDYRVAWRSMIDAILPNSQNKEAG